MTIASYLTRLENTLRSRRDFEIEQIFGDIFITGALFQARLRFYDSSTLYVAEELESLGWREIERVEYAFHYQSADGTLIFRYDNAPTSPICPPSPLTNTPPTALSPPKRRT